MKLLEIRLRQPNLKAVEFDGTPENAEFIRKLLNKNQISCFYVDVEAWSNQLSPAERAGTVQRQPFLEVDGGSGAHGGSRRVDIGQWIVVDPAQSMIGLASNYSILAGIPAEVYEILEAKDIDPKTGEEYEEVPVDYTGEENTGESEGPIDQAEEA